jgi:hypothetical protein
VKWLVIPFRAVPKNGQLQKTGDAEMSHALRLHDGLGTIAEDPSRGILLAYGTTKPVDATPGYAPGCIWQNVGTYAEATTIYVNTGTKASCTFTAMDINLTEMGLISGLLATSAELNRAAQLSTRTVAAGAATLALTVAAHDQRTVLCDQAAGCTFTLPSAAAATVGARFRIVTSVTATSNSNIIQVANASDYMVGLLSALSDNVAPGMGGWATSNTGTLSTESDTITFNRSTTGTAIKGQWVEVECIAANIWNVRGAIAQSSTEATPFSAAV